VLIAAIFGLIVMLKPDTPVIEDFHASSTSMKYGEFSILSWRVKNAKEVTIDSGIGSQPSSGSYQVKPIKTTRYTLTARSNGGKEVQSSVEVTVAAPSVTIKSYTANPTSIRLGEIS